VATVQGVNNVLLRLFEGKDMFHMTTVARKPWQVELALYMTIKGEVAVGYTNRTLDSEGNEVFFLLLERDDKEIQLEDWLRGLSERGIGIAIAAETTRGYHAVSIQHFESKHEIVNVLHDLAQWNIIDNGIYELARIRTEQDAPFTNILRYNGKYKQNDIIVRRWLPPPTRWHVQILQLYAKKATLEISATRIANGCPGFTGKSTEATRTGLDIHETWEYKMAKQGWIIEKELTYRMGNLLFRCYVDALRKKADHVEVLELKSTEKAAANWRAELQLEVECALAALTYNKPTHCHVVTPNGKTFYEVQIEPEHAARHLLQLHASMTHAPNCGMCIWKSWCRGWRHDVE